MKRSLSSRKAKKGFVLIAVSVFLIAALLVSGCARSEKKSYEDQMVSILKDSKKELDANHKELIKVEAEKDSKKKDKDKKKVLEKQTKTLEETRDQIEAVPTPDDFYSGQSDLIEFLNLLIESREQTIKNIGKKQSPSMGQTDSEAFKTFQNSGRAFSRASSELPFLEYELRDTFETVLQDVQMDVQQQSGFGQPSPGPSSISPGQQVP